MGKGVKCKDIIECIEELAPARLAETWDNSGLNVGSEEQDVNSVLLCLDTTKAAVDEACRVGANMIISHHPMLFSPIRRINIDSVIGSIIKKLLVNEISVYCAHTNVDRTFGGLNDLLFGLLGLLPSEVQSADASNDSFEFYRIGKLDREMSFKEFCEYVSSRLRQPDIMATFSDQQDHNRRMIRKVAVMCGSFDIGVDVLKCNSVDAVVSGELKHHQALELNDMGIGAVIAGHHGTERFFINLVERWIRDRYPDVKIYSYGFDSPPVRRLLL